MTTNEAVVFAVMVFVAILMLALAMIVPTAGTAAQASRKMRKRIGRHLEMQEPGITSLLRSQYLNELSPFERTVEDLPVFRPLSRVVEQSGESVTVARILLTGVLLALAVSVVTFLFFRSIRFSLITGLIVFFVPIVNLYRKRAARLNRFEEQLPEALDIMARALKAGHPFNETLSLISEEMQDPIAGEFGRVFSDLNFGLPLKASFQGVLMRIPSMSLHTLITAVLIQRESGGALAEILDKVAAVIRGRFKLQRKLKTLSAEGRLSAWILAMIPFALSLMMMVIAPDYLPMLLEEPLGRNLIFAAFAMMLIGVLWIRKIIRIEV